MRTKQNNFHIGVKARSSPKFPIVKPHIANGPTSRRAFIFLKHVLIVPSFPHCGAHMVQISTCYQCGRFRSSPISVAPAPPTSPAPAPHVLPPRIPTPSPATPDTSHTPGIPAARVSSTLTAPTKSRRRRPAAIPVQGPDTSSFSYRDSVSVTVLDRPSGCDGHTVACHQHHLHVRRS
eukprot:g11843.t1